VNDLPSQSDSLQDVLLTAADAAARSIPPAWPLSSSVAVNPFLGQTGEPLHRAAARLERVAGVAVTMPRSWYLEQIRGGRVADADLEAALVAAPPELRPAGVDALKAAAATATPAPRALPTFAELAASETGTDWPGLIEDRLGGWAADFFDQGQALWTAPRSRGAYAEWRRVATHDLTPEIHGVANFAAHVADAPDTAGRAIVQCTRTLGVSADAAEAYFHRLLMTLGGWSQYARHLQWQAELAGARDNTIVELLAIRLLWEEALHACHGEAVAPRWREALAAFAEPIAPGPDHVIDAILQSAVERAGQRELMATLAAAPARPAPVRPTLQAAFCIDVRSEVFRRALESVDSGVETLGFAGFFGIATRHRRFASDVEELRLPVLLRPGVASRAGGPEDAERDRYSRFRQRAHRAWGRFKLAAVSSFAFVEAMGPVYIAKLIRDGLGLGGHVAEADPPPQLDPGLDEKARIDAAEQVLRAMSLTERFARLVLLIGHGANVVNNPHASALQCGACGGYSGEVNARLLAGLLNDTTVRRGLRERGISVPADTLFVAALHDTTTDRPTLYERDRAAPAHADDLARARQWLVRAGAIARGERALRLPRAARPGDLERRSRDWAEVRPEWGLAGCSAFIAAPRGRTAGCELGGRVFLHDYDWRRDQGFRVLELILTAPVVVASWISLQYYGSAVAPAAFGGGDKLLHNVIGGVGVVEGNGGLMRAGLPWQSVHDGERFVHEPLRLSVCIEAPHAAMTDILQRHPQVGSLFDNGWLYLFALDDNGDPAWRYAGNGAWSACGPAAPVGDPAAAAV